MSRPQFTAILFVLSASLLAIAQAPPPPNPQQPVDYIAWINERLGTPAARETGELYRSALKDLTVDAAADELARKAPAEWTAEDRAKLKAWVAQNETCLSGISKAAARDKCFLTLASDSGALVDVLLPELSELRTACRLLGARASLHAADGDMGAALDDIATIVRLGDHIEAQPVIISHLVGVACNALAYKALGAVLRQPEAKFDSMIARSKLSRLAHPSPNVRAAIQGERLQAWDMLQRYLKDLDGDGRVDQFADMAALDIRAFALPKPEPLDDVRARVDRFFDEGTKLAQRPYAEARPRLLQITQEQETQKRDVARLLAPDLPRLIELSTREKSQRRAMWLVVQLLAYHAQHNRWPEQLELVLPPGDKDGVRDPLTDKPYGYRVVDGQPLLYTLGSDGKDDGGRMSPPGTDKRWDTSPDYVFWPPAE